MDYVYLLCNHTEKSIYICDICLKLFNFHKFQPGRLVVNKCQKEIIAIFNLSGVALLHCVNGCMYVIM